MSNDLPCDWRAGFVMNPQQKQRVGYLVHFEGLNMDDYLKQDIDVFTPYNNSEANYGEAELDNDTGKMTCVGVIDSFSFNGGVGDLQIFGLTFVAVDLTSNSKIACHVLGFFQKIS